MDPLEILSDKVFQAKKRIEQCQKDNMSITLAMIEREAEMKAITQRAQEQLNQNQAIIDRENAFIELMEESIKKMQG